MSIIRDIADAVKETQKTLSWVSKARDSAEMLRGDAASLEKRFFDRPLDSVARRARKSILYFPVVASEGLDGETVAAVAKAVQARATEYTRLMVTNMDPLSTDSQQSKNSLVSSLRGATLKDALIGENVEAVNAASAYLRKHAQELLEGFAEDEDLRPALERAMLAEAESTNGSQPHGARRTKYADGSQGDEFSMPGGPGDTPLTGRRVPRDPDADEMRRRSEEMVDAVRRLNSTDPKEQAKGLEDLFELQNTFGGAGLGQAAKDPKAAKYLQMMKQLPADATVEQVRSGNKVARRNDMEMEKLHRYPPTILDLQIQYQVNGEVLPSRSELALGIKAVAHIVPSLDLVTGLGNALQRDSFVLQFLRLTSGETSFLKDFVLNLGVAKARASSKTTSGTKVLETLRRQSEWNDRRSTWLMSMISRRGFVPPTTTVVVTSDEVDRIRSLYNVDFSKPSTAREMMRTHNLMGFMIVDEGIGLVRVFEDGDDDFDRVPMSEIRQRGKDAGIKDLMTVLAKR